MGQVLGQFISPICQVTNQLAAGMQRVSQWPYSVVVQSNLCQATLTMPIPHHKHLTLNKPEDGHTMTCLHDLMQRRLEPFDSQPTGEVASRNEDHIFMRAGSSLPITWLCQFTQF